MVTRNVALAALASALLQFPPYARLRGNQGARFMVDDGRSRTNIISSNEADGSSEALVKGCDRFNKSLMESATRGNVSRYMFLKNSKLVALLILNAPYGALASSFNGPKQITLPLVSNGAAYETAFYVGNQQFSAVVDTGSPFLLVSGLSRKSVPSDDGSVPLYDESVVEFCGEAVYAEWRRGSLRLKGYASPSEIEKISRGKRVLSSYSDRLKNRNYIATFDPINFGVIRQVEAIGGTSAVYLGLAKERRLDAFAKPKKEVGDARIRPTFLEQIDAESMRLNFVDQTLTLAWKPLIPSWSDAIPLIDVRPFGAPLAFYSFKIHRLFANGKEVILPRPCIATIDTGLTGMLVSDTFCVDCLSGLRDWRAVKSVQVEALTEKRCTISFNSDGNSEFPLLIFETPLDWKGKVFQKDDVKPDFIFLGLSFLDKLRLTIDIDNMRLGATMTSGYASLATN